MPLLHGPQSGTTTLPDLPMAAMWMCAAVAGPVSFANVSFHFSVDPVSVPLNWPCAAVSFTTCFGTSCPDESAAVQTVARVAASDSAATASAHSATAAISGTSFLTIPSLGCREEFAARARSVLDGHPLAEALEDELALVRV